MHRQPGRKILSPTHILCHDQIHTISNLETMQGARNKMLIDVYSCTNSQEKVLKEEVYQDSVRGEKGVDFVSHLGQWLSIHGGSCLY